MKKSGIKNYLFYLAVIIYLVSLGFLRDYIFVNVNYQLSKIYYHDSFDYSLPLKLKWLENFTYENLYYFKFGLTLLFTLLYYLATWFVIQKLFDQKKYNRLALLVNMLVFAFAVMIYLSGKIFNLYESCYEISRFFSGIQQSPLLLMILILAFKISRANEKAGQL